MTLPWPALTAGILLFVASTLLVVRKARRRRGKVLLERILSPRGSDDTGPPILRDMLFALEEAYTRQEPAPAVFFLSDDMQDQLQVDVFLDRLLGRRTSFSNTRILGSTLLERKREGDTERSFWIMDLSRKVQRTDASASSLLLESSRTIWSLHKHVAAPDQIPGAGGRCPSCKTPLPERPHSPRCPYCEAALNSGRYGWTLTRLQAPLTFAQHTLLSPRSTHSPLLEAALRRTILHTILPEAFPTTNTLPCLPGARTRLLQMIRPAHTSPICLTVNDVQVLASLSPRTRHALLTLTFQRAILEGPAVEDLLDPFPLTRHLLLHIDEPSSTVTGVELPEAGHPFLAARLTTLYTPSIDALLLLAGVLLAEGRNPSRIMEDLEPLPIPLHLRTLLHYHLPLAAQGRTGIPLPLTPAARRATLTALQRLANRISPPPSPVLLSYLRDLLED
ncbi:hypothetical protein Spith_0332 [Spirochaeta thermophila DSM 6578]|uniref:Uncharacterized protein n=1 Tax=Winmispira thermophila (strain ATCC 700085 / DSM 6578 / Z-1203) TaxID=869211 RepID=G0GDY6_WINT7|nr:hypothetical protein [Spirochaeta thermophila]AEJ60618.1 hypothetical protein Spith_0332 [Spirochaeta thermophila DSM 6578]